MATSERQPPKPLSQQGACEGGGPANRVDMGPTGTPRENQTPSPRPAKVAHPNVLTKDSLTCVEQS